MSRSFVRAVDCSSLLWDVLQLSTRKFAFAAILSREDAHLTNLDSVVPLNPYYIIIRYSRWNMKPLPVKPRLYEFRDVGFCRSSNFWTPRYPSVCFKHRCWHLVAPSAASARRSMAREPGAFLWALPTARGWCDWSNEQTQPFGLGKLLGGQQQGDTWHVQFPSGRRLEVLSSQTKIETDDQQIP